MLRTKSDLTVTASSRRAPLAPSLCTQIGRCASRRASLSTLPVCAAAQALLANSTSLRLCAAGCGAVQHAHPDSRHAMLDACATLGIRLLHTYSHDIILWPRLDCGRSCQHRTQQTKNYKFLIRKWLNHCTGGFPVQEPYGVCRKQETCTRACMLYTICSEECDNTCREFAMLSGRRCLAFAPRCCHKSSLAKQSGERINMKHDTHARAKATGPANTAMLPKTSSEVTLPSRNRNAPNALRRLHPVVLCVQVMKRSKAGATATASVKRSGRTKFCTCICIKPQLVSPMMRSNRSSTRWCWQAAGRQGRSQRRRGRQRTVQKPA